MFLVLITLILLILNIPHVMSHRAVHAAVQDFAAGAMENWGLIIYRETALLYDPDTATADQRQRVAKVIAHELAHQVRGQNGPTL